MDLQRSGQHLCERCSSIFQHKDPSSTFNDPKNRLLWQPNFRAVKASANIGCQLCADLVKELSAERWFKEDMGPMYCFLGFDFDRERAPIDWFIVFEAMDKIQDKDKENGFMFGFYYFAAADSGSPSHPSNAIPTSEAIVSTQDRLEKAKGWLRNCTKHHPACMGVPVDLDRLPTRLIKLWKEESQIRARLIEREDMTKSQYVSLSYRWGSEPTLLLKSTTLLDLKENIPLDRLNQLFRDTFEVVLQLGCNYVWIDGLCIIQDSQSDWAYEAQRMADVYQFAYFNIAATATTDSNTSLFSSKLLDCFTLLEVAVDIQLFGHRLTGPFQLIERGFWQKRVGNAELNRRGWVVQERFFSPRILHFGRDQILWECQELKASEIWPEGLHRHIYIINMAYHTIANLSVDSNSDDIWRAWLNVVDAYTSSALTFSSDKLYAIAGMVKRFEGLFQDRNVVGLWQKDLAKELLWRGFSQQTRPRPSDSRAPSWTWICLDRQVLFSSRLIKIEPVASIQSVNITIHDTRTIGRLSIKAPLAKFIFPIPEIDPEIRWNQVSGKQRHLKVQVYIDDITGDFEGLDVEIQDMSKDSNERAIWVYMILITCTADISDGEGMQGLVLRRQQEPGVYSRIGWFKVSAPSDTNGLQYFLEDSFELSDQDYHEDHGGGIVSTTII